MPIPNLPEATTLELVSPEKRKLIQKLIVLILHTRRCQKRENESIGEWQCSIAHCRRMKNILIHMITCTALKSCSFPYCSTIRQIIYHWGSCKNCDCPICPPLKQASNSQQQIGCSLLSENMKGLLMSKEFCDVTLHVKDKEFKAHKIILAARSSVFAAMFKHETVEKQTGIVNITDCDPESFQHFLIYLYSGEFESISFQNALNLFKTADKYNVLELQDFCIKFLGKNLKVENFCDAAILAKEFGEKELLASVQKFFNRNLREIFASDEWKMFFTENSTLANNLLLEMALKVNVTE